MPAMTSPTPRNPGAEGTSEVPGQRRHRSKTSSQMYVLSADGSKLFLLDPSTPDGHEQPPAYHTIHSPASASSSVLPDASRDDPWSSFNPNEEAIAGPSSPRSVTVHELPSVRSSASIHRVRSASVHGRNRASTTSAVRSPHTTFRRTISAGNTPRRAVSVRSQPYGDTRRNTTGVDDETTPLLSGTSLSKRRGRLRSIVCGELEEDDQAQTWKAGWRRFWDPVGSGTYWRAVLHLVILNFPFALLFWPFLFVGTVTGTVLLITLPLGAAVWWLTLILARSAARLEVSDTTYADLDQELISQIIMQTTYHTTPDHQSARAYHPIFHRQLEDGLEGAGEEVGDVLWERGFVKCSYAMFCDHYSYSALAYFVLYKPLITLFSSIAIWALLPVAVATVFGLPIYLRAARRWGRWQAGFAMENL